MPSSLSFTLRTLLATLLALLVNLPSASAASLSLVTSLRPLHLIAEAIAAPADETENLLPTNASPHDYHLRPGDMQRLYQANLVIWVGPSMESFLVRALGGLPASVSRLELEDTLTRHLEEARQSGHNHESRGESHSAESEGADAHDHQRPKPVEEAHQGHRHAPGASDPHIWLDPENGLKIAELIARELSRLNPDSATTYAANLKAFTHELETTDRAIQEELEPVRDIGYFVFHDAYGPFEDHYRLNHLGSFTLNPSLKPGARHLAQIRTRLEAREGRCVFSEPQFRPALIEAVTRDLPLRHAELDPLGSRAESYPEFLRQLARGFSRCLGGE